MVLASAHEDVDVVGTEFHGQDDYPQLSCGCAEGIRAKRFNKLVHEHVTAILWSELQVVVALAEAALAETRGVAASDWFYFHCVAGSAPRAVDSSRYTSAFRHPVYAAAEK